MPVRRHAWTQVAAALISVVLCLEMAAWGHSGLDDPGCNPAAVLLTHHSLRVTADTTASQTPEQHCLLCHFLHLLNLALSAQPLTAADIAQVAQRWSPETVPIVSLLSFSVPSRGPPAGLV
jgi:hypothetical protein